MTKPDREVLPPAGLIFEVLPKIAAEIGPIAKMHTNQQQNYKFRGIADVMNAVNPVLAKHGVTVIPVVKSMTREERASKTGGVLTTTILTIDYQFWASDGTCITATVIGEGMDSGDKSSNKAMSAGFKYALTQIFTIPFAADDSETENPQPVPRQTQEQSAKPKQQARKERAKPSAVVMKWVEWLTRDPTIDALNESTKELPELEKPDKVIVWKLMTDYSHRRGWVFDKDQLKFLDNRQEPAKSA